MNRILAIIGAVCFVAAVAIGHFADVDSAGVIEVAAAAFALCAVVVSAACCAALAGSRSLYSRR